MINRCLRLCLVTDTRNKSFQFNKHFILQAVQGGVTSVQFREKNLNLSEVRHMALELKSLLKPLKVPFIINDHVELAKEIDADGVHIGQSDLSPFAARKILGPNKIMGWSVESLEELAIANQLTCIDYIAASAVFPSKNKLDCKTIWKIDGLRKIVKQSKHPVVAIGGINPENVEEVMSTGVCGVAVIGAIYDHENPTQAATDLVNRINQSLERKKYV